MDVNVMKELREALDSTIKPIVLSGEGRSFCAGGDIISLVKSNYSPRYALNMAGSLGYHIATLPQEKIAILDGIVLGGGVGFAMGCSSQILTNKSLIGIPETSIGHAPDVGVSLYLNNLVSTQLGLFLILTGHTLDGIDSYFAKLSNLYIPELTSTIKNEILENGLQGASRFLRSPESSDCKMLRYLPAVEQCFDTSFDMETICKKLENAGSEWCRGVLKNIRNLCPLSLKIARECYIRARHMDLYDVIEMEHNCSVKAIELRESNFYIGIQHRLINKLKTRPNWLPSSIEGVSDQLVNRLFADTSYKLIEYKL